MLPVQAFMNVFKLRFNMLKKGSRTGYFFEPHNVTCSCTDRVAVAVVHYSLFKVKWIVYQDVSDSGRIGRNRFEIHAMPPNADRYISNDRKGNKKERARVHYTKIDCSHRSALRHADASRPSARARAR
jgi:hypothetical protein